MSPQEQKPNKKGHPTSISYWAAVSSCLLFLIATAFFNWLVNPYYMTSSPDIEGVNENKTQFFFQLGMSKPYQYYQANPEGIILGSSRAGSAINPNHDPLQIENYYNLAIPGARMAQIEQTFTSAVKGRGIKKVIICLDFFGFNIYATLHPVFANSFRTRMTSVSPPYFDRNFISQMLSDYSSSILSFNALKDSAITIQKQDHTKAGEISFFTLENNGYWYSTYAKKRNILNAFTKTEESYLTNNWFPKENRKFSFFSPDGKSETFKQFESILTLAQQEGVQATFVILPIHARLLETLAQAGLWENFELWKKSLIYYNEKVALSAGSDPFPIWDFSGYSEVSMEEINNKTNAEDLHWMYDSSHASANTGNRVLDIIFDLENADIGLKISRKNINDWLKFQRDQKNRYRSANPETVKNISINIEDIRRTKPWKVFNPPKNFRTENK